MSYDAISCWLLFLLKIVNKQMLHEEYQKWVMKGAKVFGVSYFASVTTINQSLIKAPVPMPFTAKKSKRSETSTLDICYYSLIFHWLSTCVHLIATIRRGNKVCCPSFSSVNSFNLQHKMPKTTKVFRNAWPFLALGCCLVLDILYAKFQLLMFARIVAT